MATLHDYQAFAGRHWETGSIHNYFAYRGFRAPHTGEPYSEALLLGVSGGITVGYFTFAYEGFDPQCNILTRNTFDPWDTLLSRLGVGQEVAQTAKRERAEQNLLAVLAEGTPAVVWADLWSLSYNALSEKDGMWGMFPLLVYGYEPEENRALLADRAQVPLEVTAEGLLEARGRTKKHKYRQITLEAPDADKLASAVSLGIHDTIRLYLEKPPRGTANNFGLAALRHWARMLREPRQRASWEKIFPAGPEMYAGLTTAYHFAFQFGKGLEEDAERGVYADFLEEAASLLNRPGLRQAANLFRESGACWRRLPAVLLPDRVVPLGEARQLMQRRHHLFLEQGGASLAERLAINERLAGIRQEMEQAFPLDAGEVQKLREAVAEQLDRVHDAEEAAVQALQDAVA